MLARSDVPIGEALALLGKHGVHSSPLVPTRIGLQKAIMDAIGPMREYLERHGIHNYSLQAKGQDAKRMVDAVFIRAQSEEQTFASLYRPESKEGDPRIWFRGLPAYANAHNLLAVIAQSNKLYVVNCSDPGLLATITVEGSPLNRLARSFENQLSSIAQDLLDRLRGISRLGYVQSIRRGDTGIGMTLEKFLGIRPNADRTPDFHGIEIKAARRRPRIVNRVSLFSQVPNWDISELGSGVAILREYGYKRDGRRQLYCTVSAAKPNSQGLFFLVVDEEDMLRNRAVWGDRFSEVVCWRLEALRERLKEKHHETMWIKAEVKINDAGDESFHYTAAVHTRQPIVDHLEALLRDSTITMDYTLSERASGTSARDHGYLFKIHPSRITALFPPARHYDLLTL